MRWVSAVAIVSTALLLLSAVPAPAAEATTHVVQPGETLYRIARRYGLTVSALAAYNHLSDPTRLSVGQVLRIPARGARAASVSKPPAKPVPPPQTVTYRYTVSQGDTLALIAGRYGITVQSLMRANGLQSNLIHPGQRLLIPGVRVTLRTPPPGPMVTVKAADASPIVHSNPEVPEVDFAVGDTVTIQHPLRVRRGPGNYYTTLALVAPPAQLQVTAESNGWVELALPEGEPGWVHRDDLRGSPITRFLDKAKATGAAIVREAMQYVGTRYVWGGRSSGGLDCSGLIYVVYSAFSSDLGRMSSYDYFRMGVPVEQTDLQPGDLVFFTTYAPGASHVGIYAGDRKFIHAASSIQQVTVSVLDEAYYVARYIGARRIVAAAASSTP